MKRLNRLRPNRIWRLVFAALCLVALGAISVFIVQSTLMSGISTTHSPYAGQLTSTVRGLSGQEVDDLLNGRGAGYARTAELNSYPGPRHVLDLHTELQLSAEQMQRIEQIYQRMNAEAKRVGQLIVARERQLSAAFAQGTVTEAALADQVAEVAGLYGQLRTIHLRAHLEMTPLLSSEQIAAYDQLRGYDYDMDGETQDQHPHNDH